MFTSPLYPNSNRTSFDCTWSVMVPQNLKVAIRFPSNVTISFSELFKKFSILAFDMGSNLMCEKDYVEFLEENDAKEMTSIKRYCGGDDPAIYVSPKSKVLVHYVQTVNFAGTGWIINFIGVQEGKEDIRPFKIFNYNGSLTLKVLNLSHGRWKAKVCCN